MESRDPPNSDEFINDMHDLAGVRIALYLPSQMDDVDRLIEEIFLKVESTLTKPNPTVWGNQSEQAPYPGGYEAGRYFTGYMARHCRVRLRDEDADPSREDPSSAEQLVRLGKGVIEIQVASVVMHAWAEVHHDMVYKPDLDGLPLLPQQSRFLDMINGLAMTSQLALIGLAADIEEQRETYRRAPFDSQAMTKFLKSAFGVTDEGEFSKLAQVTLKLLAKSLEAFQLNTPVKLDPFAKKWKRTGSPTTRLYQHRCPRMPQQTGKSQACRQRRIR
jgi:ppGpp synthetase/RelA/SpoT-type nucleotidyltranferase